MSNPTNNSNLGLNADLVSIRPPHEVQAYVEKNFLFGAMLPIETGHGPINQDYYAVTVTHLPQLNGRTVTAEQLLNHFRTHLYDFTAHQSATFHAYDKAEQNKWDSPNPLGAVIQIDMTPGWKAPIGGMEDGSVVVSSYAPDHWIFSTIRTIADIDHPVSGNREFGFKHQEDGNSVFYIRGTDRPTGYFDQYIIQKMIFQGSHELWSSFQQEFTSFIKSHGGEANVTSTIHEQNNWDAVSAIYHHPTTSWISEGEDHHHASQPSHEGQVSALSDAGGYTGISDGAFDVNVVFDLELSALKHDIPHVASFQIHLYS